jgi:hypothetical protein
MRGCDAASTCQGATGTLVGEHTLPVCDAVDIAVEDTNGWIATESGVELWSLAPAALVGARPVSHARAIAAGQGTALLASDDGVRLVTQSSEGLELSEPQRVCGRPLRVASIGSQRWLVVSTLGLAVVDTSTGEPQLLSLAPLGGPGDDDDVFPALVPDHATLEACHDVDQGMLKSQVEGMANHSGAAKLGADRAIVWRGQQLFEVRTHGGVHPYVRQALKVDDGAYALRVSADGSRAYFAGGGDHLVDLRPDHWTVGAKHDVTPWVRRRDGSGVAAWVDGDHVRVAEVVR